MYFPRFPPPKRLLRQREAEDRLLQQEISLRDQIFRDVQRMEARRQELLEKREQDLYELAQLEGGSSDEAEECDPQQPNEVMAFYNNIRNNVSKIFLVYGHQSLS